MADLRGLTPPFRESDNRWRVVFDKERRCYQVNASPDWRGRTRGDAVRLALSLNAYSRKIIQYATE